MLFSNNKVIFRLIGEPKPLSLKRKLGKLKELSTKLQMRKVPIAKRKALLEMIESLGSNPSTENLLRTFNKGKEMYFGDILNAVQINFEISELDVKFIVVSMKQGEYRNKRFKIKLPESRSVTLADFETIYTYMILAAFGNNPDQEPSKVKCIHESIFGDSPVKTVIFKDHLKMFVEYNGKHLSYVKTRDSDGETYRITEHTKGVLDSIRPTTRIHSGIVVYTRDPDFEEQLLLLDM
jgi:hypothetical protein